MNSKLFKIISLSVLVFLLNSLFQPVQAQQTAANSKVSTAYSTDELSSMSNEQIKKLNFLSNKGYFFFYDVDYANKLVDINTVATIKPNLPIQFVVNQPELFNPIIFNGNAVQGKQFRLGNTGYIVTFLSEARSTNLFQTSTNN